MTSHAAVENPASFDRLTMNELGYVLPALSKSKSLGSRLRGVFNSRMAGHDEQEP
jgi:hypothetical protein